jgi:hypothetical protein
MQTHIVTADLRKNNYPWRGAKVKIVRAEGDKLYIAREIKRWSVEGAFVDWEIYPDPVAASDLREIDL